MTHRTALAWRWAFKAADHGAFAWHMARKAASAGASERMRSNYKVWAGHDAASYGVYFAGLVGELVRAGCYEDAAPAVALQMVFEAHQVAGRGTP